ncbi:potassium transporter TrkA [filamentous cyanobacterium CCP2]|nr:potassium transporter TrkA [filamentous cyanobacterium CCP2]
MGILLVLFPIFTIAFAASSLKLKLTPLSSQSNSQSSILSPQFSSAMSHTNLTELASRGDPGAISKLLARSLQIAGADLRVDWHGEQLNVRLFADRLPDQESLLASLHQQIQALDIDAVRSVRVFAYQTNNPAPTWSRSIALTEPPASSPASASPYTLLMPSNSVDRFLVCGLGSLGQYSVLNLKRFAMRTSEIHVTAIEQMPFEEWEVQDLPSLLEAPPIIGDCRNDDVLLSAGIQQCRAVLIVTSNDSVNVETAIAARRLNPTVRIVMRSSRHNLNQLLRQQLGDFIALEPTELPAPAFALAGLQQEILGFFNIGDYRFQVVEQQVQPRDYRFDGFPAVALHKKTYRLLSYIPTSAIGFPSRAFYQWQADTKVQVGDTIAFVEVVGRETQPSGSPTLQEKTMQRFWHGAGETLRRGWRGNWAEVGQWMQAQRTRQVIAIGLTFALLLWLCGAVLLRSTLDVPWKTAFSAAFILLIGGYGDVFEGLEPSDVPGWVKVVCALITLTSLASVLGVLGLIADNLISSRFDFLKKRFPIPRENHVVVVGLGRIGQQIASILREFRQPVVAITDQIESQVEADYPVLQGDIITELPKVNLATAKSVVVVTDDQMLNLEVALMAKNAARQMEREIGVVIRTYDQRFRDNLNDLLPDAKALAAYELSAEAFAGAAFGENILGLFRLNNQTILVTEYQVTQDDTLVGKSLYKIAYGYGVVPIVHHRTNQSIQDNLAEFILPPDERILAVGDRLVVLASINGLRRIEHEELVPPRRWRLEVQKPLNRTFLHDCGSDLARIAGYNLTEARAFMENLPGAIELSLYDYQAYRLEQELCRQLPMTLLPLT